MHTQLTDKDIKVKCLEFAIAFNTGIYNSEGILKTAKKYYDWIYEALPAKLQQKADDKT